jgi:hypothetical protein
MVEQGTHKPLDVSSNLTLATALFIRRSKTNFAEKDPLHVLAVLSLMIRLS